MKKLVQKYIKYREKRTAILKEKNLKHLKNIALQHLNLLSFH